MNDADRIFLLFMVAALGGMLLAPLAAALLDAGRRLVAAIPRAQGGLLAPWRDRAPGEGFEKEARDA